MDRRDLDNLRRLELQRLCKDYGLKANGKNAELITRLENYLASNQDTTTFTQNEAADDEPSQVQKQLASMTERADRRVSSSSNRSTRSSTRKSLQAMQVDAHARQAVSEEDIEMAEAEGDNKENEVPTAEPLMQEKEIGNNPFATGNTMMDFEEKSISKKNFSDVAVSVQVELESRVAQMEKLPTPERKKIVENIYPSTTPSTAPKFMTPSTLKMRFNSLHEKGFKKMDSIAAHYSVKRRLTTDPDTPLTGSKRKDHQGGGGATSLSSSPWKKRRLGDDAAGTTEGTMIEKLRAYEPIYTQGEIKTDRRVAKPSGKRITSAITSMRKVRPNTVNDSSRKIKLQTSQTIHPSATETTTIVKKVTHLVQPASAVTRVKPAPSKTFDVQASLKRPLGYVPHKGSLKSLDDVQKSVPSKSMVIPRASTTAHVVTTTAISRSENPRFARSKSTVVTNDRPASVAALKPSRTKSTVVTKDMPAVVIPLKPSRTRYTVPSKAVVSSTKAKLQPKASAPERAAAKDPAEAEGHASTAKGATVEILVTGPRPKRGTSATLLERSEESKEGSASMAKDIVVQVPATGPSPKRTRSATLLERSKEVAAAQVAPAPKSTKSVIRKAPVIGKQKESKAVIVTAAPKPAVSKTMTGKKFAREKVEARTEKTGTEVKPTQRKKAFATVNLVATN
ncbi:hypothetical protein BC937DRAFT_88366 [Endogone sp. FLAS-F59071]|nr:hypothetical protein BC937DRAFT_88366 [Endogone sp. FLAS-F59071]|eukprot:RUS22579.1 hypothetical protein BC937DRAFT_88366 [Endogone sp. FLAS-F59071]